MKLLRVIKPVAYCAVIAAIGGGLYATRAIWLPHFTGEKPAQGESAAEVAEETAEPPGKIIVNEQAQENLGLTSKPLKAQTFWKTIQVPGMIVDRPGLSDRGVVAPATGVVSRVFHIPGDTVRSGEPLFTLKLLSESLHMTQTELFKATQDITLALAQRKRLQEAVGAVPEAKLIEVDNQVTRLEVAVKAYRQELSNRGFTRDMIDAVASGKFVNEITISVPLRPASTTARPSPTIPAEEKPTADQMLSFEVQELKGELGQQVQVGQLLCTLANHQLLAIEGRAFRDETSLLERSVKEKWPVEVDFQEEASTDWGEVKQSFRIRHLSNTIDPKNRTFAFLLPIENESRTVEDEGRTQTLWRFRPGQKVRLHIRVEELKNVLVLPADAVTQDGSEAFLFTQNVNTFTRRPVRILLQDSRRVVIVNDGSIAPGTYAVQTAAAKLNRMVKAGGASGIPKGYHVHADGSLHKNEDEGK